MAADVEPAEQPGPPAAHPRAIRCTVHRHSPPNAPRPRLRALRRRRRLPRPTRTLREGRRAGPLGTQAALGRMLHRKHGRDGSRAVTAAPRHDRLGVGVGVGLGVGLAGRR